MIPVEYSSIGYGVVIHDTKPDMETIEIAVYEHVTLDREYKREKEKDPKKIELEKEYIIDSAIDGNGNIIIANISAPDMTINARWLNRGSPRITPPVLYAGATVEVYKYKSTDRYYYEPMHIEPDLQGKEVAVFAFSNTDNSKDKEFGKHFDAETSYTFTVSSLEKRVLFKTPTNDGEPIGFTFNLDTAKGKLTMDAGNGEKIVWDPANKRLDVNITTVNFTGSIFTFNAKSAFSIITNSFKLKAGQALIDTMCKFMKLCDHMAKVKFNKKSKDIENVLLD